MVLIRQIFLFFSSQAIIADCWTNYLSLNLKLSPAAVKVERARKPRLLCDHSWYPINETTISRAPQESMQFGGTLARIL